MINASPTGLTDQQIDELRAIQSYLHQIQDALTNATIRQRVTPTSIAAARMVANNIIKRLDNLNTINATGALKS